METRQGFCRYCNNGKLIEVREDAAQAEIDEMVTEECDCIQAVLARKKEEQRRRCSESIRKLLGEHYPEIAELFLNSIENIQDGKMKKITVNTRGNQTARMCETKDGIKVELEKKRKEEYLA